MSAPNGHFEEMCPLQQWVTTMGGMNADCDIQLLTGFLAAKIDPSAKVDPERTAAAKEFGRFTYEWLFHGNGNDFRPVIIS